jgi:hypothetical protein
MTKFKNPIFSLLFVSIFFTSCNGQTKTEQPNKTVGEQQSFTSKMYIVVCKTKTETFGLGQQAKVFTDMTAKNLHNSQKKTV